MLYIIENLPRAGNERTIPQMIYINHFSFLFGFVFIEMYSAGQTQASTCFATGRWGQAATEKNDHYFTLLLVFVVFVTRFDYYKTYISKSMPYALLRKSQYKQILPPTHYKLCPDQTI